MGEVLSVDRIAADASNRGLVAIFTVRFPPTMGGGQPVGSGAWVPAILDESDYPASARYQVKLVPLDDRFEAAVFEVVDIESLLNNYPRMCRHEMRSPGEVDHLRKAYWARNVSYAVFDERPDLENPERNAWLRDALLRAHATSQTPVEAIVAAADAAEAHAGDDTYRVSYHGIAALLRRLAAERSAEATPQIMANPTP